MGAVAHYEREGYISVPCKVVRSFCVLAWMVSIFIMKLLRVIGAVVTVYSVGEAKYYPMVVASLHPRLPFNMKCARAATKESNILNH